MSSAGTSTNRYAIHAPPEAVWRPCVTCTALSIDGNDGKPKETSGLCYCGEAYCHLHQDGHEQGCKVAQAQEQAR